MKRKSIDVSESIPWTPPPFWAPIPPPPKSPTGTLKFNSENLRPPPFATPAANPALTAPAAAAAPILAAVTVAAGSTVDVSIWRLNITSAHNWGGKKNPPSGSTPIWGIFPIPIYGEANCPYGSTLVNRPILASYILSLNSFQPVKLSFSAYCPWNP